MRHNQDSVFVIYTNTGNYGVYTNEISFVDKIYGPYAAKITKRVKINFHNQPIDDLQLTIRSSNTLKFAGIYYVKELVSLTRDDLLKIQGLGRKSVIDIEEALEKDNLKLKQSEEDIANQHKVRVNKFLWS